MLAPSPRQCRAPLGVLAWQRPKGPHGGLFGFSRPSRRHRSAENEPHAEPGGWIFHRRVGTPHTPCPAGLSQHQAVQGFPHAGFQQQLLPNWAAGGALEDPLAEVSGGRRGSRV